MTNTEASHPDVTTPDPPTGHLLAAMTRAVNLFSHDADPNELFTSLLDDLLALSASEYGYIGEVLFDDEGAPYLQTRAITDISWDDESRRLFDEYVARGDGLQFRNLDTLFGWGLRDGGRIVIANDLDDDPRCSGRPGGHPPLDAYLALPIIRGTELVGQIAVANRKGGYDQAIAEFLEPYTAAVGTLIDGYRAHRLRRVAEAERARSEGKLTAITSHLTDIVTLLGNDGAWTLLDSAGSRALGQPNAFDPTSGIFSALHPDDVEVATLALEEIAQGRRTPDEPFDLRVRAADGSYRILESVGDNLTDDPIITGILLASRDVTDRRHAERVLRERNSEMDALLESLQTGVLFVDDDKRIIVANAALCEMFDFRGSPGDLVGMSSLGIRRDAEQAVLDSEEFRRGIELIYQENTRRVGDLIRMRDGRTLERDYTPVIRERHSSARPVIGGVKNAHLWIYRDVTQREMLDAQRHELLERERALRRATQDQNRSLLEIDELKNQFVATVSHELRTPLASIVGFAEVLLDEEGHGREEQFEFLQIIHRNSQHLLELVEDLLLISRLESGDQRIDPRPTLLPELIDDVVRTFGVEATTKRVELVVAASSDAVPAIIDRSRFDQVIRNLVSNALKFTEAGGQVTVSTARRAAGWVIQVRDTGIGIADEDLDRVFDRFFRGSNAQGRQHPGSGLGLAIARGIVELHGGSIEVASSSDGTVFTVDLPDPQAPTPGSVR
jgi:PAS domain S-box-containing protein